MTRNAIEMTRNAIEMTRSNEGDEGEKRTAMVKSGANPELGFRSVYHKLIYSIECRTRTESQRTAECGMNGMRNADKRNAKCGQAERGTWNADKRNAEHGMRTSGTRAVPTMIKYRIQCPPRNGAGHRLGGFQHSNKSEAGGDIWRCQIAGNGRGLRKCNRRDTHGLIM